MRNLLVWDALIAWRDFILKKDIFRQSKINYLSNMAKLIEIGILDVKQSLTEINKTSLDRAIIEINAMSELSKSTKRIRCYTLKIFHRFVFEEKIEKTDIVIPFEEFRDMKRVAISELLSSNVEKSKSYQQLDTPDILRFMWEMCVVNSRDSLICWMMWEFKCCEFANPVH